MLLNLVVLNARIAGWVVEGFSRAAVVGDVVIADAAVGRGGPGRWGGLLAFVLAAFHEGFVGLALTTAEVGFVASEAL